MGHSSPNNMPAPMKENTPKTPAWRSDLVELAAPHTKCFFSQVPLVLITLDGLLCAFINY